MIRDLRFEELERADRRRRTTRLVIACFVLSTAVTFGVSREFKIRQEYAALPEAQIGDLPSLRMRHDAIDALLAKHHIWTGAFSAREEIDDLVVSIAEEERNVASLEKKRAEEEVRIREEAEAARNRGLILAERKDYGGALGQFHKALELCDSLGEEGWDGGPWEHRDQVVVDIYALESLEGVSK